MNCGKRKFDKLGVMMALAKIQAPTWTNPKRQEKRFYFCADCHAYHLTSQDFKVDKP